LASQRNNNNWTTNEVVNLKANIKSRGSSHAVVLCHIATHSRSLYGLAHNRDEQCWLVARDEAACGLGDVDLIWLGWKW
jgi:hypothetical protein